MEMKLQFPTNLINSKPGSCKCAEKHKQTIINCTENETVFYLRANSDTFVIFIKRSFIVTKSGNLDESIKEISHICYRCLEYILRAFKSKNGRQFGLIKMFLNAEICLPC